MKSFTEWLSRGSAPKRAKKRIPKVSKKRARENRIYSKKRKAFLEAHPYDMAIIKVFGQNEANVIAGGGYAELAIVPLRSNSQPCFAPLEAWQTIPRSTEIHHVRGRGKYLNDESSWLAISRPTHNFIHAHPKEARELNLLQ